MPKTTSSDNTYSCLKHDTVMHMANLQIRNFPDALHSTLAKRARSQGVTMSEYVTTLLERDLSRPTTDEWLTAVRKHRQNQPMRQIDMGKLMDEVKGEWE